MSDAPAALASLGWLDPWAPLASERASTLEQQLARELGEGHALQGRRVRALAARTDTDDVLFEVFDPWQLAVVHLTYAKPRSSESPLCMCFESVEAFTEGCMEPDHLEHVDSDV